MGLRHQTSEAPRYSQRDICVDVVWRGYRLIIQGGNVVIEVLLLRSNEFDS